MLGYFTNLYAGVTLLVCFGVFGFYKLFICTPTECQQAQENLDEYLDELFEIDEREF